ELFCRIVFDDEQALAAWGSILFNARKRLLNSFRSSWLCDEGEGPASKTMVPVFVKGEHLNRNVACSWILLQVIEYGPAKHVWEKYVQRNCARFVFPRQCKRLRASH